MVAVGDNVALNGESKSTATLELQGGQLDLLDALAATATPLIIVLINGKPLCLPASVQNAAAIIELFNPGTRDGVEIIQLYTSDLVTSATWVGKELKAFQRVPLKAGETRTAQFSVPATALSLVNAACERVVEPGEFEVLIGPYSRDNALLRARFQVTGCL